MSTHLLSPWGLAEPRDVRRPASGTNNDVVLLRSGAHRYVLRTYSDAAPDRVRREHALLDALGRLDLPFAVPSPLPTSCGTSVAQTAAGVSALFALLPGEPPQVRDLPTLTTTGAALGALDVALARLPRRLAPRDWRSGELATLHPRVPELRALVDDLRAELPQHPGVDWFDGCQQTVEPQLARLPTSLPRQIVHGDFAHSNLLMQRGAVSAVLDFEFAGWDLRVNDLVVGLLQAGTSQDAAEGRAGLAAFRAGYAEHVALTPDEVGAIPLLVRYRASGSVVWRAGRWRDGLSTAADVAERLTRGMALEAHLDAYAG